MNSNGFYYIVIRDDGKQTTYYQETFSDSISTTRRKMIQLGIARFGDEDTIYIQKVQLFHVEGGQTIIARPPFKEVTDAQSGRPSTGD